MDQPLQRALVSDLAIIAATAAWPLVLWQQARAGELGWPDPPRLTAEVAAAVTALGAVLAWRRRHTVAVGIGLLPLAASAFAVVPALVALYTVAASGRRRVAIGLAVAYLAVALAGAAVIDPPTTWVAHVVTIAAFHAIAVALGMVRAARQELLAQYEERAHRAESEQQLRVARARQLERQRIAREMHDVVAHRLSMVSLHAGALAYRSDTWDPEGRQAAEIIRESAHEALEEVRDVIGVLREGGEDEALARPQPTLADLPALIDRCRAAGATVTVHDHTDDAVTPTTVGRTAFRVVEEGLTNAAKHAPSAPVEVTLDVRARQSLIVEVSNPLPLIRRSAADAPVPGAGAGLVGLAERVGLVGGRLRHGPTSAGRFDLRAELPWTH